MEKVQTGFVIEFYSNACLVRTKVGDIPCIAIKDVVVGDIVKIEIIQDSKEIKEQYDNIFKKFISYVKNIKKINKIDLQKLR